MGDYLYLCGMKENTYFTPDIEDIRVGYECEIGHYTYEYPNGLSKAKENWEKTIIDEQNISDLINLGTILNKVDYPIIWIRVPYLTKEQIEAEGWKVLDKKSPFTGKPYLFQKKYEIYFNEPHTLTLEWNDRGNPNLVIRHEWESSYMRFDKYIYYGECKDINTFRTILKLLKIDKDE